MANESRAAGSEAAAAKPTELPPLPKEHCVVNAASHLKEHHWKAYTAEQMREYARAALAASLPPSRELLLRAAALLSERMPCADPECRVADDSATQRCYDDLCRAASLPPSRPEQIAARICREVAELPDRNSPEGWPEAMLVTHDELRSIVLATVGLPPSPQPSKTDTDKAEVDRWEMCWLVELFHRGDGAPSLGRYHTGLTDLAHQSRSTANAHEAKRYAKEQAERIATELNQHMMACEWRAVEHGFLMAAPQPSPDGVKESGDA